MAADAKVASAHGAPSSNAERLKALAAKKREKLKQEVEKERAEEESTTERWSGLRIAERCIRQEKWDACMRGKELVKFERLAGLSPQAKDTVLIGVLCAEPQSAKLNHREELSTEFRLTNLDKEKPEELTLVLVARAAEHWATKDGLGREHASVGSIIAVLNPVLTGRNKAVLVSFETQVVKLGRCPALAFCSVLSSLGKPCGASCNAEMSSYCAHHANQSHGARQAELDKSASKNRKPGLRMDAALPRPAASLAKTSRSTAAPDKDSSSGAAAMESIGGRALLESLKQIEVSGKPPGDELYATLGALAQRADEAGEVAKRLRRTFRARKADEASSQSAQSEAKRRNVIGAGR